MPPGLKGFSFSFKKVCCLLIGFSALLPFQEGLHDTAAQILNDFLFELDATDP